MVRRWKKWCESVGIIDDIYLDHFTKYQQIKLIEAFSMAMCGGKYLGPAYDTLAEGTIRSTISYVAQNFRENDSPNPTKDEDGQIGRLQSWQ